jgi:TetR/AcrR family transcriptional regulator
MPPSSRLTATERRESIIRAAIKLFSERGFRGTTTRELAAACGISEPTIYQHFPSKRDLYNAIIDTIATRDINLDQIRRQLTSLARGRDDAEYFRGVVLLILDFYRKHTSFVRLLEFSSLERHELAPMFFERLSCEFFDEIAAYLQLRMDEGAFYPGNARMLADLLIGAVDHYATSSIVYAFPPRPDEPVENWIEQVVAVFLRGIRSSHCPSTAHVP